MKKTITFFSIVFTLLLLCRKAQAQTDGAADTSFDTGAGFDTAVFTIAVQPDGKILLGGLFSTYKWETQNRIIRLNTDGSVDTSFDTGTGFDATVSTIVLQPDGKILVGGQFTKYKDLDQPYIARLNTDGSLDDSFDIGTGFNVNGFVNAIVLQPDGKILVGGNFTTYKDLTQNRIARLNADGSLDTDFDIGTGLGGVVNTIALQPDGKILAGGMFTAYNGTNRRRIIRLNTDGSLDTSFGIGTGFNNYVHRIAVQPDGKILVTGQFSTYNESDQPRIARLNTDGNPDDTFVTGSGFSALVNAIAFQSDGKILIGGNFETYNGSTQNRIVRLNTDGSVDNSFNIGTGFNSNVQTIALQADRKILVGGTFTSYKGTSQFCISRLHNTFAINTSSNPAEGGTTTGDGAYNYGATATLTATANTGYTFVNWTEEGAEISTEPEYNFTVTADRDLTANFTLNTHTISISANPTEGGTVTGGGTHNYGATITLTATANEDYTFVNWTEGETEVSTEPEYSFTITANRNLVANFKVETLPVTLTTFTAKANGSHARLQWQTASELNNKTFIVYRSTDGVNYTEIARQESKGNGANSYTAYDNNPANGANYYRLTQTDDNRTISHLADAAISFSLPAADVKVWQNPADKQLNLAFAAGKYQNLRLLDVTGKALQKQTLTSTQNEIVLNVGSYPKGTYVVELRGGNGSHIVKILK